MWKWPQKQPGGEERPHGLPTVAVAKSTRSRVSQRVVRRLVLRPPLSAHPTAAGCAESLAAHLRP